MEMLRTVNINGKENIVEATAMKRKRESTRESERKRRARINDKLTLLKSLLFREEESKLVKYEDVVDQAIEVINRLTFMEQGLNKI